VSAWADEAAKVKPLTQWYVAKPVSLDHLLETVSRFCEKAKRSFRSRSAVPTAGRSSPPRRSFRRRASATGAHERVPSGACTRASTRRSRSPSS
jgi:hypothetical protein